MIMRGAIFMCNKQTRHECFKFRVFGLPASKVSFVKQIKKGMILFLFDTDDRKMYGVYEAISDGGLNFVPHAYEKTGSHFPAQVRFRIIWKCWYLTENEFKPAIIANYFTPNKFNQYLTFEQVRNLLSLFETKKKTAEPNENRSPRTSSSASHLPRTSSRLSSNPNPSFNPDRYQFQSSNFDSRRLSSNPNPNPNPESYQFQSSSFDNMRLITNPNPNPNSYQFQMSNFDNMHLSSNPNPNPDPYQHSTCAGPYQYQYDPNNPGIASSSHYVTQNNQPYQTGTSTVPDLKCEADPNQDQTKPHPFCDYRAIKNKGEYGSSSRPVQFYTSNPENYNNVAMGIEGSNVGEGSQHQSHICDQVPENFYASVFERLQGIPSAQQNPNFVPELPNPSPRLYADSERQSVFSRLVAKAQREETKPSQNDEGPSFDQLLYSLREKSNQWSGQRKENSKSNQWVSDKATKPIEKLIEKPVEKQVSTEIEAEADPGSDGMKMEMDVDLTEPSLDNFELDESKIPFLNFKRRSGERKVSVEPEEEGSKKKRRFVRPNLEIEGPIRKFDISFDEIMKEAETEETNVEKKDSKEAEPTIHEIEGKNEELVTPNFMEIGSESLNQDLQGPSCKNGLSKEIEMECESGPTTADPQEEGEIVFSPLLLQINEENNTEELKNVGPAQNDNLSCNEGKNDNVEKYPAYNQESETEKNETEKKNDAENLNVIELETQSEAVKIEFGEKNEVKNDNENLNLVELEAQSEVGKIALGEKKEVENDNENLNVVEFEAQNFMEISIERKDITNTESEIPNYETELKSGIHKDETELKSDIPKDESEPKSGIPKGETKLKSGIPKDETDLKSGISKDETGPQSGISKDEIGPKSGISKDETERKSDFSKDETEPKSGISEDEMGPKSGISKDGTERKSSISKDETEPKSGISKDETDPKSGIPKDETDPKSGIPKDETDPKSGISKDEMRAKSGISKDETEPKSGISKDETDPRSGIPKEESEPKTGIPKEETQPKSGIPKEETKSKSGIPKETEPKSGNIKPGLGFDIRSLIRQAKAEKINEAGTCKDQEDILNGDFIALD